MIGQPVYQKNDASKGGPTSAKKSYCRPALIRLGTFQELTRHVSGFGSRDGGSGAHSYTGRGGRNGGSRQS